jgi:hypothetical protein
VQLRDQLVETPVVLPQPPDLRVERLGEPGELLVRGQIPVLDHRRSGHREVHRPEQLRIQLGLVARELLRRRRGQADQVEVAELTHGGPHHIAPEGGEVVAFVEHERADAALAQQVQPLERRRGEQLGEVEGVPTLRDPALERRPHAGKLGPPAGRGRPGPRRGVGPHLLGGRAGGPRALDHPARLGELLEGGAGVVQPAEGLVGEASHRRVGRGTGDGSGTRLRRAEASHRPQPHRLDRGVGSEHDGPATDPSHHLHPQQRLA